MAEGERVERVGRRWVVWFGVAGFLLVLAAGGWWFASRHVPGMMSDRRLVELVKKREVDGEWSEPRWVVALRQKLMGRYALAEEYARRLVADENESMLFLAIEYRVKPDARASNGIFKVLRAEVYPDPDQLRRLADEDPAYGLLVVEELMQSTGRYYERDRALGQELSPELWRACLAYLEFMAAMPDEEFNISLASSIVRNAYGVISECESGERTPITNFYDEYGLTADGYGRMIGMRGGVLKEIGLRLIEELESGCLCCVDDG